jgi:protein-L-isoaspartate O-methyltransferase
VTLETFRRFYARYVLGRANVVDDRLLEAFAVVERERFVGTGLWQVP